MNKTTRMLWVIIAALSVLLVYSQLPLKDVGQQVSNKPLEKSVPVSEPPVQRPTATEVFNLRTKCVELGSKLSEQYSFAAIPFPNNIPLLKQSEVTNYDPKANRCYVEVKVTANADILAFMMSLPAKSRNSPGVTKFHEAFDVFDRTYDITYNERHLYDGQTGEELAYVQMGLKGKAPIGLITSTGKDDWSEALEKIDQAMSDNRQR